MRLRTRSREDEAFDGLTAEEVRKIRAAGSSMVTPGLEGLAKLSGVAPVRRSAAVAPPAPAPSKNKRGRRS